MAIATPNQTRTTIRRAGRILIANQTINTLPKAGKNGTSSQFTSRVDTNPDRVPTKKGNAFGPKGYASRTPNVVPPIRRFGVPGNAAIATDQTNRTATPAQHPNSHHFNISTSYKRPALAAGGAENGYEPSSPYIGGPNSDLLIQPHERTGIGANFSKNLSRRATYRAAAGGVNSVLGSDTPFHKQTTKIQPMPLPKPTTEMVKVPVRARPSFFRSTNNLWVDPNNSFAQGIVSVGTGRVGQGRWQTIKKGVIS